MGKFTKMLKLIFNKKAFQKIIAYVLLVALFFILKDSLWLFLMTFIFAFLFYSIAKFIKEKVKFLNKIPFWIIVLIEYLIFIWLIVYIFANIIPSVKNEVKAITNQFSVINSIDKSNENLTFIQTDEAIANQSSSIKIINAVKDFKETILQKLVLIDPEDNLKIYDYIENFWKDFDFKSIWEKAVWFFSILWKSVLNIILALILSFIFILDRKKLSIYLFKIKESNFGFLYNEYEILIEKVLKSFWLILKAQWLIALVNSILTTIWLFVIGLVFATDEVKHFPYILTFGLVVFVMGFIPVLGTILSSIPIILIAYITYGDIMIIPAIILLVAIVHTIEAYYLNPKIVSSFLKLPMSLTFIILLVSEKIFGLAGLLVGISLFYFIMWLIKDFNDTVGINKKKLNKKRKNLYKKRKINKISKS